MIFVSGEYVCVVAKSEYKIILLTDFSFKYLLCLTCMVCFVGGISIKETKYTSKTVLFFEIEPSYNSVKRT